MDINDLFDGITEAFRQYQAEVTEQVSLQPTRLPLDLGRKQKLRKRRRKWLQRRELNKISRNRSDCRAFGKKLDSA